MLRGPRCVILDITNHICVSSCVDMVLQISPPPIRGHLFFVERHPTLPVNRFVSVALEGF